MASSASNEIPKLAAATANRLRLLQIDFAEHPAEERRKFLSEEIERVLKNVLPAQRHEFLEDLRARFPTWEASDGAVHAPVAAAPVPQSSFDESQLNDAGFLVERLKRIAPTLSETARQVVAEQLKAVGIKGHEAPGGLPAQAVEEVAKKYGIQTVDAQRALDLDVLVHDMLTRLDQLVWQTWQTIAPQSTMKRPSALARTLGPFVAGDPNVSRGQVSQDLDRLRQLIAALVTATGQAGKQFAAAHVNKFSPNEIQAVVELEKKGGFFGSKEVACWRKYVALFGEMDSIAVEREISHAIAEFAERLMKGLAR